jgi:hypothetical protein
MVELKHKRSARCQEPRHPKECAPRILQVGEEVEIDDEIEPAKPFDGGRASFVQPTPDRVQPITQKSPDTFSDRIDDSDRDASIAKDPGQVAAVACKGKDAGARGREAAIDQVLDEASGVGVQRRRRQW